MVKTKLKTKSDTEAYTYTLTKSEKGKKIYVSFIPKPTFSILDDSLSIQIFHGCRYIKLIVEL